MSDVNVLLLILAVSLVSCAESTVRVPERDAGLAGDATEPDQGPSDVGRDLASATPDTGPGHPLTEVLTCGLDEEMALAGVMRHASCFGADDGWSPMGLFRAWEAGMLGLYSESGFLGVPRLSCGQWSCLAAAENCVDATLCEVGPDFCDGGEQRCVDDTLEKCIRGVFRRSIDCRALGEDFACQTEDGDAFCASGDCRLTSRVTDISCVDDALVMCDGAVRVPCDLVRPGSMCTFALLGGEFPAEYCGTGPTEIYPDSLATTCESGILSFPDLSDEPIRFDCIAEGYSGCPNSVTACTP